MPVSRLPPIQKTRMDSWPEWMGDVNARIIDIHPTISLVDPATQNLIQTIDLTGFGSQPTQVKQPPAGKW